MSDVVLFGTFMCPYLLTQMVGVYSCHAWPYSYDRGVTLRDEALQYIAVEH